MTRIHFALLLGLASSVYGQEAAKRLEFEVASIKAVAPLAMPPGGGTFLIRSGMRVTGTRMDYPNVSLRECIRTAYGLKDYQINAPGWMATVHFDIEARLPEGATKEQVPAMLQSLLEDRFKLSVHHAQAEHDVYGLVAAKSGPKLTPADPDAPNELGLEPGMSESDLKALADKLTEKGMAQAMSRVRDRTLMSNMGGTYRIDLQAQTLPEFANSISRYVDRPVVDMTGIEGKYDFTLEMSSQDFMRANPMMDQVRAAMGAAGMSAGGNASDPSGNSIFEALQKYGLKLEKRKASIDTLVIDSAEKVPSEN